MRFPEVNLSLPAWIEELTEPGVKYPKIEDRMKLVVELSRLNVRHETGGPFGAAIFDRETGELLAPGVNLVKTANCSVAHAEMVAIMVAQQTVEDFDLGGPGKPHYELVASTEPCAMCLGAIPWSGVRGLVTGAWGEDAEEIGFDEGVKPQYWMDSLKGRGISVTQDVLREEAVAVLKEYAASEGEIYNSRKNHEAPPEH